MDTITIVVAAAAAAVNISHPARISTVIGSVEVSTRVLAPARLGIIKAAVAAVAGKSMSWWWWWNNYKVTYDLVS